MEGVDYSWARPDPAALAAAGKRFACRYVSHDTTGKNITAAEADALAAVGISVVTNWEWDAADQLGGYTRGAQHAEAADRLHRAAGGSPGRPIYFSTDFDATDDQLAVCYDYLRGAGSVIGADRVGVYGGYRTIAHMHAKGVRWLWQTYAWSAGAWHSAAGIRQYRNGVRLAGGEVDLNRATTSDFGQWIPGGDVSAREVWQYPITDPGDGEDKHAQVMLGYGYDIVQQIRTLVGDGFAAVNDRLDGMDEKLSAMRDGSDELEQR